MNRVGWFESLAQDVRYAWRGMRRSPVVTVVAVTTLAVSIGVNATVFTLTNAFFKGYALVDEGERILYLRSQNTNRPDAHYAVSYPDYQDWRAQTTSFQDMGACRDVARVSLNDDTAGPETLWAVQVSANTFELIRQTPLIGRTFASADEAPGAAPVTILTYGLWEHRYSRDPNVVGRTVRINGTPTTVIGVMPQGLLFPNKQDLWMPLTAPPAERRDARNYLMFVFGRMADGVTIDTARAEMETIGRRLGTVYPQTNDGFLPRVETFGEFFHGRSLPIYEAMLGAVGFVLLIACANMANLMLARSAGRARELFVRIALGAGRWEIVRQLLVESLLLSGLGGLLGWFLAQWGVRAYVLMAFAQYHPTASPELYPWFDFTMDQRVVWYLIAISAGAGLLFGLAPASRLMALDVNSTLKDGGRGTSGGVRNRRHFSFLVAGEMAMAIVLLTGAGVMMRSVLNLYTADIGVDTARILTTYVPLQCEAPFCAAPDARYPDAAARIVFFDRVTTRLAAMPGVEAVALATRRPAGGASIFPYALVGDAPVEARRRPTLSALIVDSHYFQTLGVALLAGRDFNDADGASGPPVALVNQRFAQQHWPGEDPLGQRLRVFDDDVPGGWLTVVGVAPDIVQDFARQRIDPLVYMPYRQRAVEAMTVIARTRVPPESLAATVQREIQALDPDLPVFESLSLSPRLDGDYRFNYALPFVIFAAIALLLASIGLYAVIAHSLSQRTQEIGIRMAMGATAQDVLALVFSQGMRPVGAGLAAGLAASFAVTPVLRSVLVEVSPADPITFVGAPLVLMVAAMLGCLIPGLRATRVDPVIALRHD